MPGIYLVRPEDRAAAVSAGLEPDPTLPRVCVIGAGSSGIAAAKALYQARVPFDCFELGSVVGGNWVFRNPNGQSACYRSLEINTSCPRMAYSDFPMPDYYPDYARHYEVRDYFERYVDHFGFRDRISFETKVEHVHRRPADGLYEVTLSGSGAAGGDRKAAGERRTLLYDAVMVCNGHHWDARWPEPAYPGAAEFKGRQLHAHDYREPSELEGKRVVVVGMGNSAMDIAVDSSYVAEQTYISVRRGQWVFPKFTAGRPTDQRVPPSWVPWELRRRMIELIARRRGDPAAVGLPAPDHRPGQSHPVQSEQLFDRIRDGRVIAKGAIERLTGDGVRFADGSEVAADVIVWATGYRVSFPFLDPELISAPDNSLPLWKRAIEPDLPGLFFIGLLQPLGAVMPIAEAQSVWLTELLTGAYLPPSKETMRTLLAAEHERMASRFYRSARHTMEVDFDDYLAGLARERAAGRRRAQRNPNLRAIPARAAAESARATEPGRAAEPGPAAASAA